jgi:hypothetical protein
MTTPRGAGAVLAKSMAGWSAMKKKGGWEEVVTDMAGGV